MRRLPHLAIYKVENNSTMATQDVTQTRRGGDLVI